MRHRHREGFNDLKPGDIIEAYEIEETRPEPLLEVGRPLHPEGEVQPCSSASHASPCRFGQSGSLKAKRQVLRRVTDRVKARFNVAVAEVEDQDLWQRATIALAVVGDERRHVDEQMEKIIHFVEEMYVAPLLNRETEILAFGDQLFSRGGAPDDGSPARAPLRPRGPEPGRGRGHGGWDRRPGALVQEAPAAGWGRLSFEARARAAARGTCASAEN